MWLAWLFKELGDEPINKKFKFKIREKGILKKEYQEKVQICKDEVRKVNTQKELRFATNAKYIYKYMHFLPPDDAKC